MLPAFLPTTLDEARARGWDELDVVIVTGDAHVDHPAFGPILVARFLEGMGLRVGVLAQPDWRSAEDFRRLGRPRLFFGVSAGNLDSMLHHLTAQRRRRGDDPYSPGGEPGRRPDRAVIVYSHRAREAYPGVPIVLGGIEASLRRIAHYDHWSDRVRGPVLLDAKADLLVFGMGEAPLRAIVEGLRAGRPLADLRRLRGTAWPLTSTEADALLADGGAASGEGRAVELPAYEEAAAPTPEGRVAFARMARMAQAESSPFNGRALVQRAAGRAVLLNPSSLPLDQAALDAIYELPFRREAHPSCGAPVPALETVRHSLAALRGCFGGCAFCSITEHEGKTVQWRSASSLLREVDRLRRQPGFRGVLSDVGGPTANMYGMRCRDRAVEARCRRPSCLWPRLCEHLDADHAPLLDLLARLRDAPGVRHVFVASGVRHDLILEGGHGREYLEALACHHVGGQLSVAPEHSSPAVLACMRKPGIGAYERFVDELRRASAAAGKEQYPIPYFISGHPGTRLEDMVDLALFLKRHGLRPRQVQDFIPTPMSLATTMHYTGLDPRTMTPIAVERSLRGKKLQKALLLYWDPAQHDLVREALVAAGREDLIGRGPSCLVPPRARGRPRR